MFQYKIINNTRPQKSTNPSFVVRHMEFFCQNYVENGADENDYAVACIHSTQAIPVSTDVCAKHQIAMKCVSEYDA